MCLRFVKEIETLVIEIVLVKVYVFVGYYSNGFIHGISFLLTIVI